MRLATLDRKLLRDLKRLRSQAIAVSSVLADQELAGLSGSSTR